MRTGRGGSGAKGPATLARNVAANLLGRGISSVLTLVAAPIYVRLMGAESFGVIGFYTVGQAIIAAGDLGLIGALTRETARLVASDSTMESARELAKTVETLFVALSCGICLGTLLSAPAVCNLWLKPETLSRSDVTLALRLASVALTCQFLFLPYQGALTGVEEFVSINALVTSCNCARVAGTTLALAMIAPTVSVFFACQAIIGLCQVAGGRVLLYRNLRMHRHVQRRWRAVYHLRRFIGALALTSALGVVLTQCDRIVVSRSLPLKEFGYYSIAGVLASIPMIMAMPVFSAVYPRLTQLASLHSNDQLYRTYHRSCQVVTVLLIPALVALVIFPREAIELWSPDRALTLQAGGFVRILVLGACCGAAMLVPYALQLACGITRLGLLWNVSALFVLPPALVLAVSWHGAQGAAFAAVALYGGQLLVLVPIMHRKLPIGPARTWYWQVLVKPLSLSLATALFLSPLLRYVDGRFARGAFVLGVSTITALVGAVASDSVRAGAADRIRDAAQRMRR